MSINLCVGITLLGRLPHRSQSGQDKIHVVHWQVFGDTASYSQSHESQPKATKTAGKLEAVELELRSLGHHVLYDKLSECILVFALGANESQYDSEAAEQTREKMESNGLHSLCLDAWNGLARS